MMCPRESSSRGELGVVLSDATYQLREFQRITGLGDSALRAARRKGLTVRRVGRLSFVRGQDFHHYLQNLPDSGRGRLVTAYDCRVGGAGV